LKQLVNGGTYFFSNWEFCASSTSIDFYTLHKYVISPIPPLFLWSPVFSSCYL
jgi:hypothetical protein